MSTKQSILLTDKDEHWYLDLLGGIILEINFDSIESINWGDKLKIELKEDSELFKLLKDKRI